MNVNIFLILMLVLIGIVGIVMSLLFTSKNTENKKRAFDSFFVAVGNKMCYTD